MLVSSFLCWGELLKSLLNARGLRFHLSSLTSPPTSFLSPSLYLPLHPSPHTAKIKRVVAALNYPGPVDWDYFSNELHSIAGAMKQYLRELPEPLLTFQVDKNR